MSASTTNNAPSHSVYHIGAGKDFCVFFDEAHLPMDPVTEADIEPVEIKAGSEFASAAWSCNCDWYFIFGDDDILLFNVYSEEGIRCKKKSAMFIEAFLDAPILGKRRARKGKAEVTR